MELFASHTDHSQQNHLEGFLQFRKSDKGCYFGEYLAHGDMDIKCRCVVTTMQRLIDAGLFALKTDLGDKSKWNQWARRVIYLRESFGSSRDASAATLAEVRKAVTIARACFGDHWDLPVATMLLALKRCKRKDPVVLDRFATLFAGK